MCINIVLIYVCGQVRKVIQARPINLYLNWLVLVTRLGELYIYK